MDQQYSDEVTFPNIVLSVDSISWGSSEDECAAFEEIEKIGWVEKRVEQSQNAPGTKLYVGNGKLRKFNCQDDTMLKKLENKMELFDNSHLVKNFINGNFDDLSSDGGDGSDNSESEGSSEKQDHKQYISLPEGMEIRTKECLQIRPYLETILHISLVGQQKCLAPFDRIIVTSIMGGAFVAFGMQFALFTAGNIEYDDEGMSKMLFGFCSSVGIVLCLYAGADLFAGNVFMSTMALLFKKIKWYHLLRMLILATLGNVLGGLLVAYVFTYIPFDSRSSTGDKETFLWCLTVQRISRNKIEAKWYELLLRSINANAAVSVAVFLGARAKSGVDKFLSLIWPTACVVGLGLELQTSNSYLIPLGMFYGVTPWYMFFYNLALVTSGNIIGGVCLVSVTFFYIYKRSLEYKNFVKNTMKMVYKKISPGTFKSANEFKRTWNAIGNGVKLGRRSKSLYHRDPRQDHIELRSL